MKTTTRSRCSSKETINLVKEEEREELGAAASPADEAGTGTRSSTLARSEVGSSTLTRYGGGAGVEPEAGHFKIRVNCAEEKEKSEKQTRQKDVKKKVRKVL